MTFIYGSKTNSCLKNLRRHMNRDGNAQFINTLKPAQNGRHLQIYGIFKGISLNENV